MSLTPSPAPAADAAPGPATATPAAPRPPGRHGARLGWSGRLLLALGLLLALHAGFAYLAFEPLVRASLPRLAQEKLASRAEVGRVALDPWRLRLTVEGLRLTRPDGGPLAGFDRLEADFQADSLLRWAWHFREIRLAGPRVHLETDGEGRLNWAGLLAALAGDGPPPPPATTLPRLRVDRLELTGGGIDYVQARPASPLRAALQPLDLTLEELSTLPDDRGHHLLQARLPQQGGSLRWKGDFALNPPASQGEVDLQGLQLARLLELVKAPGLPVAGVSGEAGARFGYRVDLVQGTPAPYLQARLQDLTLTLEGPGADLQAPPSAPARVQAHQVQVRAPRVALDLREPAAFAVQDLALALRDVRLSRQGRDLFSLAQGQAAGVAFDLASRRLRAADVVLQEGRVQSRRDASGALDWQALAEALAAPGQPPRAAPSAPAAAQAGPLRIAVERVRLERWQAQHRDDAFKAPLDIAVSGIDLAFGIGEADGGIALTGLAGDVTGVSLKSALEPQPAATLARLRLEGGRASLAARTARLDSLVLSGLRSRVLRPGVDQPLNWQALLEPRTPAAPRAASARRGAAPQAAASGGPGWTASLGRLALEDAGLRLEDRGLATPASLELRGGRLELRELSLAGERPVAVNARLPLASGGTLEASGRWSPQPLRADLQLRANGVDLRPLGPYLSQFALLRLDGGTLDVRGRVTLAPGQAGDALAGGFRGRVAVRQLAISEEATRASFLAWQEVSSDTVRLDLAPRRLQVDSLRLVRPVGKFLVDADGTLNATHLLRPQPAGQAPKPQAPAAAPAAPFAVAVDRVHVDNASLEFADLSLRPQFGTHIDALSGVINGLSNDPATTAQVELDGRVEEFGSARVRGTVQPFRATESTDLRLSFRNLEMASLTPYSGKFAGRRIDAGRLSVDLAYKVKDRQLAGENRFVIERIKLGERVDSPDAVNLPLDLAIAILQDSDGVIDLDLPVTGNLDDPQFSYGRVIWRAFTNVLTRLVTAPFRALGRLLGVESDTLQAVAFDPASAALAPQEQEKLVTVARALERRPGLRLAIVPNYDPARDSTALQEQAMRRAVLAEAGVRLGPNEQPGPLDLFNTKVQSAIERQLKARTGGGFSLKLLDDVKDALRSAKPEDAARYAKLLEQLRPTYPVTPAQLAGLARQRGEAVRAHLEQAGRLAAQRIEVAEPAPAGGGPAGGQPQVPLRLELKAATARAG
ncbi:DUF748 domain-containing protein [Ramlibacter sp. MAHUQ-53]|uniref:DUF748 domain-containing protein n=1 Tax=unclassified Ramlibacter TaxID=2617605 RepID=UPI003644CCDA